MRHISSVPFDLTHEERETMQLLSAELDLHPERRTALLAELVLARQVVRWGRAHIDRFPPRLREKLRALLDRKGLRRIAADSRAELETDTSSARDGFAQFEKDLRTWNQR